MPVFMEDPALLTKEKLKDQLIAHHVPLPEGDPKKDVYLQMYKKYVGLEQRAADFSSDEEEDVISDTKVKLQREKSIKSKMDVQNLSDAELKEQLIIHGTMPGPILPTTRTVYEKKLKQLLDQGPPVPQERQNGNGDMDQYSDSEEEGPREIRAQRGRDATFADVSDSSIFNHSKQKRPVLTVVVPVPRRSSLTPVPKRSDCTTSPRTAHRDTPFSPPSEASKSNAAFESTFSVTRMVEQMDQRPSMCHAGVHQKTPGSGIRSSYCAKADDLLQKDELADQYVPSTPNPLGLSATRRKPIKGAAGRPIQFKYDDILTHAKLVEQAKVQTEKVLTRKLIPVYVHVAVFAFVVFLALVFLTMEHNPENPFNAHVEKVEVHQPQ